MSLLRPAWRKHRDATSPASPAPLETLDDGQLLSLAMADPADGRALAAVRHLRDSESLRLVAGECSSLACREAAYERLGDAQRAYLMRWLVDPGLTREVILGQGLSSADKKRIELAVEGLTDPAALRELIALTDDDALKARALEKLGYPLPDASDGELDAIAAETAERLLANVLAGHVHPSIVLLHKLRGSAKWVPGLERVLDDEAYAPAFLGVLSFLRGKTDDPDWQRFINKNAPKISVVLKRVLDEVTSSKELLEVVSTCGYLLLAWHGCVNESHVDMLAQHMQRYGLHRDYDGSPLQAEHVLKDIYDHGFLQDSIRRYSGTLLYEGGIIESGTGDDTYRDIWEDTYFLV
ncbi:MAG: hypothetical protein JXA57_15930 [Armatimonadetes bacterium]|nr:hypothetical protein [Armatimonadota bacterium]